MDLNGSEIDSAGANVAKQQQSAQDATSPNKADQTGRDAAKTEYTKPAPPEFPAEKDPGVKKPIPKNKGFKERLMDKAMASQLKDSSNRPESKNDEAEYPKNQGNDINKPQPVDNTPSRPNPGIFDPSTIGTINPKQPSGDVLGNIPGGAPGSRPEVNRGPAYQPPPAFKSTGAAPPKINLPKFK